jgi:hypothetical protein
MRVGLGLLLITALAIDVQDRPIGGDVNLYSPPKKRRSARASPRMFEGPRLH